MEIKWDLTKLSSILKAFVNVCHMNINVVDSNIKYFDRSHYEHNAYCSEIQKSPKCQELCIHSDKCLFEKCRKSGKFEMQTCPAGLIDIAIPIMWSGEHIGYIVLGQVKINADFNYVAERLAPLDLNMDKMKKYYDELPLFDYNKINDIITLSTIFSKYILMENIFKLESNNIIAATISYIDENLTENLSILDITHSTGISKSSLYKNFKQQFNCTPGEYINRQRASRSASMLLYSDYSIDEIAERTGFSSASYYSKIFKKVYGISPLKYRKTKSG